ncbi:hypothetical protein ACWGK1_19275 [Streptomyces wedmorensis]
MLGAACLTGALTAGLPALPASASAATVTIAALQGSKRVSPYNNQEVTVTGIVTAIRPAGFSRGYWIQDAAGDGDPTTSEAVFAYTGSTTPSAKAGNKVTVKAKVAEYYPGGSADGGQSVTRITQPEITSTASTGNALPAAYALNAASIPDAYTPTPAAAPSRG